MMWAFAVPVGVGLLAGFLTFRVQIVVAASLATVLATVALTPFHWWPFWGLGNVIAMLFALQGSYLIGIAAACALSRLPGGEHERSGHVDVSWGAHFLWPSLADS